MNVSKCCRPSKFPWGLRFPVRPPPGARPLCYDAEVFGKGIERGRVIGKVIGGAQGEGRRAHRRHSRQIRAPCDGHAAGHVPGRGAAGRFCRRLRRRRAASACRAATACRSWPRSSGAWRDCEADAAGCSTEVRALAEMVRDTSDCAIGYEAANALLEGLGRLRRRVRAATWSARACAAGVGQTVPCETLCPAHVDVPGYIALVAAGDYAGAVNLVRKDNPFPTACAFVCEHPCEAPVPPHAHRRSGQHPRHQAVRRGPGSPPTRCHRRRTVWTPRGTSPWWGAAPSGLTCAYFLALMGHRVTVFEARKPAGRHAALRHTRLPLSARAPGRGHPRHPRRAGAITALCDTPVGAREMAEIAENYDAVYVAIGAQAGKTLALAGRGRRGRHVGR